MCHVRNNSARALFGADHDGRTVNVYLVIAVDSRTLQADDFFASGRRVPPVYNGFVLAAIAVGEVGSSPIPERCSFSASALVIGLGWTFGMFAAGVLFVLPAWTGSYTLPSFLGHHSARAALRAAASVMQLRPRRSFLSPKSDCGADTRVPAGLVLLGVS
jgi:Na+(H+)/acetate symporter ActP